MQLLNWNFHSTSYTWGKADFARMYMDILMKGSPLDAKAQIAATKKQEAK